MTVARAALAVLIALVAVPQVVASDVVVSRTDHRASGNRLASGSGPLTGATDIDPAFVAAWIIAAPTAPGETWIVVDVAGGVKVIGEDWPTTSLGLLAPGSPPSARMDASGRLVVTDATVGHGHGDPLPMSRVIRLRDGTRVLLSLLSLDLFPRPQ